MYTLHLYSSNVDTYIIVDYIYYFEGEIVINVVDALSVTLVIILL